MTALIGVGGVLLGVVLGVVLDRAVYWNRPRVTADTGRLARQALADARRVLTTAVESDGRLWRPWKLADGTPVPYDQVDDDLRQAAARVGHRAFTEQVQALRDSLKHVWDTSRDIYPQFFGGSGEETPREREEREAAEALAVRQRQHASEGLTHIEPALAILDQRERHA